MYNNFSQVEDGYSCLKNCHSNDAICLSNYTREILFQFRSVPSIKILKKPIEISRITTKINNSVFNIEYVINGQNSFNFFVEQQGNVGIVHLSKPIRGPRTENIRLHINIISRKGVSIAHNLAVIQVQVSEWDF